MFNPLSDEVLRQLADEFETPLYVYDGEKIAEQYQLLQSAFNPATTRFFYACKSLTNVNILRLIKNMGCGIDCSSINEAYLAIQSGCSPNNILYTSMG